MATDREAARAAAERFRRRRAGENVPIQSTSPGTASIWQECIEGMLLERRLIWQPLLEAIDTRRQLRLAEAGLAPDRFRRRLPARTDPG
jgi:hypothetical protein